MAQSSINCPGKHLLLTHPFDVVGTILSPVFPLSGHFGSFRASFSSYAKKGSTILSSVIVWSGTPIFWVADAEVAKQITNNPTRFPKATDLYRPLTFFGPVSLMSGDFRCLYLDCYQSVLTTEGDMWKRHRRVSQPAFSEVTSALALSPLSI